MFVTGEQKVLQSAQTGILHIEKAIESGTPNAALAFDAASIYALAARFPGSNRADGLFCAQGFASSLYIQDPDGNTVELRFYEE